MSDEPDRDEMAHYIIRGGLAGRERLRLLARVMQPTTEELFDRVGVASDARCLDVGCGGGDVTTLLAGRASRGSVVGVDVDDAKLELCREEAAAAGIANVTASRVSLKRERKLRLFQPDTYLAIDMAERSVRICRRVTSATGLPEITWEQIDLGEADALSAEIRAFLASVRTRSRPAVTGEDGLQALELCERILGVMESE